MKRRWIVTALGAALGASCGDTTPTAATQLNLDRPVDISFACYGDMRVTNGMAPTADQQIIPTAQPVASCEGWSAAMVPPGQEDVDGVSVDPPNWYGFILESAPGTVAIARWGTGSVSSFIGGTLTARVLDADPLTPGKNAISVGEEPIAIATDRSGCYEVTANAGSCDLSEFNINSALDDLIPVAGKPATPVVVKRRDVTNAMGVVRARPAAMVAEPNVKVVGNECQGTAQGLVYIAYPSCHMVAAVDTATGKIVKGIQYGDPAAPPTLTDGNVTCAAECPDPQGKLGLGAITPGVRPVTLALEFDDRTTVTQKAKRLVIGADNLSAITLVELDDNFLPTSVSQIALQDTIAMKDPTKKLGITSIALSPQIGVGGAGGNDNDIGPSGVQGQYVYGVATDNTVRVVDVLGLNAECDTQVDTRFVRGSDVKSLQCFKVGDPTTPQRRSGAKGPGIELIGDGVPTSVAFVRSLPLLDMEGKDSRNPGPTTLRGTFAIITASNGQAFVVNVDDDNNNHNPSGSDDVFYPSLPQSTAPTLIMAHQLRDSINAVNRDLGPTTTIMIQDPADSTKMISSDVPVCNGFNVTADPLGGGPHVAAAPTNNLSAGLPVSLAKVNELPSIRQVACTAAKDAANGAPVSELQLSANLLEVRDQVFPDLRSLFSDENWFLTWEGPLAQDATAAGTPPDGPTIRAGQMIVESASSSRLVDPARPFCGMGVEPFDIVQLRGCDPLKGNADCPVGYQCYVHPDAPASVVSVSGGQCMLSSEASRLANACRDFLISSRQYTVGHVDNPQQPAVASGALQLLPRQHVLRTTPLDGCTEINDDAQCKALADYDAQLAGEGVGTAPPSATRDRWACRADDTRAPNNADPTKSKRCVETCAFHDNDPKHKNNPGYDGLDRDLDCDRGTICQGAKPETATTPAVRGVCMESVMPPQACVNGPQRYDVRASEAFTVIGSHSGYIHPIITGPGGKCTRDLAVTASTLQSGRIPLKAPACGPVTTDPLTSTNPITGALPGGAGFEPNPCSLTVPQAEYETTCDGLKSVPKDPPLLASPVRMAPAIKFRARGMTLTVVDPYYPGDKTCAADRGGLFTADQIPLVFQGYQLSFKQTAGLRPLTLSSVNPGFSPVYPVKVVAGPTNSIWVLDNGDYLSTTIGVPSTRGQVYRIESSSLVTVNVLDRLQ